MGWQFVYLFYRNVSSGPLLSFFVVLLLNSKNSSYILDKNSLIYDLQVFYHIHWIWCPLKHRFLIWSNTINFLCSYFWCQLQNHILRNPRSWRLTPMFSYMSFIIVGFTFSLWSIWSEFLYMVWDRDPISFLGVMVIWLSQHDLPKRLSFLHWIILATLLKINWLEMWSFISSVLSPWFICLFLCHCHTDMITIALQ